MSALTALTTQAQTTVYIVRHAEKDLKKNPSDPDPALSLEGQDPRERSCHPFNAEKGTGCLFYPLQAYKANRRTYSLWTWRHCTNV